MQKKKRYEDLIASIKKQVATIKPPPNALWIEQFPIQIDDVLTLRMLHGISHLTKAMRSMRNKLNLIEADFDITVEIEGYTKADLPELKTDEAMLLYGFLPGIEVVGRKRGNKRLNPAERERHQRERSRRLVGILKKDLSLIRRAREHIDHLLTENQGAAGRDLQEWREILELYSPQRLEKFLTSTSHRADRLRKSNPFFAVLNKAERIQLEGK